MLPIFADQMLFPMPNQRCQSTEGNYYYSKIKELIYLTKIYSSALFIHDVRVAPITRHKLKHDVRRQHTVAQII